jgi:Uma2 family endonuclease
MSSVAQFSLEHYEHMVEVGAFSGPFQKRLELLRGEIVEMTPIGIQHANVIVLLTEWSFDVVPRDDISIRAQNPIRIPLNDSEPEPDVVWAKRQKYAQHPGPEDIFLLVEVADTSLDTDRNEKLPIYAEAGIAEYWIVNLLDEQIEVYRQPSGKTYLSKTVHQGNNAVHPLALPKVGLIPAQLFDA